MKSKVNLKILSMNLQYFNDRQRQLLLHRVHVHMNDSGFRRLRRLFFLFFILIIFFVLNFDFVRFDHRFIGRRRGLSLKKLLFSVFPATLFLGVIRLFFRFFFSLFVFIVTRRRNGAVVVGRRLLQNARRFGGEKGRKAEDK